MYSQQMEARTPCVLYFLSRVGIARLSSIIKDNIFMTPPWLAHFVLFQKFFFSDSLEEMLLMNSLTNLVR